MATREVWASRLSDLTLNENTDTEEIQKDLRAAIESLQGILQLQRTKKKRNKSIDANLASRTEQIAWYGTISKLLDEESQKVLRFLRSGMNMTEEYIPFDQLTFNRLSWLQILRAAGNELVQSQEYRAARRFFYDPMYRLLIKSIKSIDPKTTILSSMEIMGIELCIDAIYKSAYCQFQDALPSDRVIRQISTYHTICEAIRLAREGLEIAVNASHCQADSISKSGLKHKFAWLVMNGIHWIVYMVKQLQSSTGRSFIATGEVEAHSAKIYSEQVLVPFLTYCLLCMESQLVLSTVQFLKYRMYLYQLIVDMYLRLSQEASSLEMIKNYTTAASTCVNRADNSVKRLRKVEEYDLPLPSNVETCLKFAESIVRFLIARIRVAEFGCAQVLLKLEKKIPTEKLTKAEKNDIATWTFTEEIVGKVLSIESEKIIVLIDHLCKLNLDNLSSDPWKQWHKALVSYLYKSLDPFLKLFIEKVNAGTDNDDGKEAERNLSLTLPIVSHLSILGHFYTSRMLTELEVLLQTLSARRSILCIDSMENSIAERIQLEITMYKSLDRFEQKLSEMELVHDSIQVDDFESIQKHTVDICRAITACIRFRSKRCQYKCDAIPSHLKDWLIDIALNLWKRFECSICSIAKMNEKNQPTSEKEVMQHQIGRDVLVTIHETLTAVNFDDMPFRASITLRLAVLLHNQRNLTDAAQLLRNEVGKIGLERGRLIINSHQRNQSGDSNSLKRDVGRSFGCAYEALVASEYDLYTLLFRTELEILEDPSRDSSSQSSGKCDNSTEKILREDIRHNGYLSHSYYLQKLHNVCTNAKQSSTTDQKILDSASTLLNDLYLNLEAIEKQEEKLIQIPMSNSDLNKSRNCEHVTSPSRSKRLLPPKIICQSSTSVIVRYQPKCDVNWTEHKATCVECIPSYYKLYGDVAKASTRLSINSISLPGTGIRLPIDTIRSKGIQISGLNPNEKYVFALAAFDDKNEILFGGIGHALSVVALNPFPMIILNYSIAKICASLYQQIPRHKSDAHESLRKKLRASSLRSAGAVYASITKRRGSEIEKEDAQNRHASLWKQHPFHQHLLSHDVVSRLSVTELKACVSSISLMSESTRIESFLDTSARERSPLLLNSLKYARISLIGSELAFMYADNVSAMTLLIHSYRFLLPWLDLTKSAMIRPNVSCTKSWIFEALVTIFESSLLIIDTFGDQDEYLLAMTACTAFELVQISALKSYRLPTMLNLLRGMRDKKAWKKCKEVACLREILSLIELGTSFTFATNLTPQLATTASKQNTGNTAIKSLEPDTVTYFTSIEECAENCRNSNMTFQNVVTKLLPEGHSFKLDVACKLCHIALQHELDLNDQESLLSTTILDRIVSNLKLKMKINASMKLRKYINAFGPRGLEITCSQEDEPEDQNEGSHSPSDDQYLALWCGEYFFLHVIRLYRISMRAHHQHNTQAGNLHIHKVHQSWPLKDCFEQCLPKSTSKTECTSDDEDEKKLGGFVDIIEMISLCSRCFVYAEAWRCVRDSIKYLWNTLFVTWTSPEDSVWSAYALEHLVHCIDSLIVRIECLCEKTTAEITPCLPWISELLTFTLNVLIKNQAWHDVIAVAGRYHKALVSAASMKSICCTSFSAASLKFLEKWASRLVVVQKHSISAQSALQKSHEGIDSGTDDSEKLLLTAETVDLHPLRSEGVSMQRLSEKVESEKSECQRMMEDCQRLRRAILFCKKERPSPSKMAKVSIAYQRCLKLCCEKLEKMYISRGFCELGDLQWHFKQKELAVESWQDGIDYIFEVVNVLESWPQSHREIEMIDIDSKLLCRIIQINGNQSDSHAQRAWISLHAIVLLGRLVFTQSSSNLMVQHSVLGAHLIRLLLAHFCIIHPTRAFLYGSYDIGSMQELWPGHPLLCGEGSCVSPLSLILSILSFVSVLLTFSAGAGKYSQQSSFIVAGLMATTPLDTLALPAITLYESISRHHIQDLTHSVNAKRLKVEALTLAGRFGEALTQWSEIEQVTKTSAWAFASSCTLQRLLTCWTIHSANTLVETLRCFTKSHFDVDDSGISEFVGWVESIDLVVLRSQFDAQINDCVLVSLLFTTLMRLIASISSAVVGLSNAGIIMEGFSVRIVAATDKLISSLAENVQDHKAHRFCVTDWNGFGFLIMDLTSLRIQLAIAHFQWKLALSLCDDALKCKTERSSALKGEPNPNYPSPLSLEWRVPPWAFYIPHHQRLEIHILRLSILLPNRLYCDVVTEAEILLNSGEKDGTSVHLIVQLAFLQMRAYLHLGDLEASNERIEWILNQCRIHSLKQSLLYVQTLRASNELELLRLNQGPIPNQNALFDLYQNVVTKLAEAESIVDRLLEEVGWCGLSHPIDRSVNISLSALPIFTIIKLDFAQVFLSIHPFKKPKDYEKILVKIDQGLQSAKQAVNNTHSIRVRLLLLKGMIQRRLHTLHSSSFASHEIIRVFKEAITCCIQSGNHDRVLLRTAFIELVAFFVHQWEHTQHHPSSFQQAYRFMELARIVQDQEELLPRISEQCEKIAFDNIELIPSLVMDRLRHFSAVKDTDPSDNTQAVSSTQLINLLIYSYHRRDTFADSFAYHDAITNALHRFLKTNYPAYADNCVPADDEAKNGSKIPSLFMCWDQAYPLTSNSCSLYVMRYKEEDFRVLKHLIFTRQQRTLFQKLGQNASAIRREAEASSSHEALSAYTERWNKLLIDLQSICEECAENPNTTTEQLLLPGDSDTAEIRHLFLQRLSWLQLFLECDRSVCLWEDEALCHFLWRIFETIQSK